MNTQRHRYDYQVRPNSAPEKVIRMVAGDRSVLELGPGPGSITRHLQKNGCRVTALEYDPDAITLASEFCERIFHCDLNDPDWPELLRENEKFSVIVAADVLEHLYDPWATLKKTQSLLAADGCVVISLPHIAHNAVIACLLNEDFAYRPWGLLDSTHIRFWGLKNIEALFADAGYKIIEADFVITPPEQTEFAENWKKLPEATRKALRCNPFGNVYQVVIRAVPQNAPGLAIRLEELAVPDAPDIPRTKLLLRRLGGYLPLRLQTRVLAMLRSMGLWS